MAGYWFDLDWAIVSGDDFSATLTWALADGTAVDISSWSFSYEANEVSGSGTAGITVADGAMTKSNSGSGVVDTVTIPLSATDTAKTDGRYAHDLKVTIGTDATTVARGTLEIKPSEQD
jgi:hypothetical protein